MARWVLIATVTFVPINLHSQAQARPDFSGKWTLTTKPQPDTGELHLRPCAEVLVLTQDPSMLRVQAGDDPARARTYRFDGADRIEALAPAAARPAGTSPTTWEGHTTRFVARAAWNGNRFVTVTHSTMTMTWPSQLPGEFERETAAKDVYAFNQAGQLVVEHLVLTDPLPGGTPQRLDLPDSWTCAYAK